MREARETDGSVVFAGDGRHGRGLRRRWWWVLVLLAAFAVWTAAPVLAQAPTTLILVRHAEKATEPAGDPVLSPAGEARAGHLAEILGKEELAAVYASETTRARETARPTAERQGLEITSYPPLELESLIRRVFADHRGETVLVVGHSNTVPDLVRLLGGEDPGEMPETEYDSLFVVTVSLEGQAGVLRLAF